MNHWEGAEPETCLSLALGEPEAAAGAALARRQLEATGCEKRKGSFATGILCPDCQEEPAVADGKLLSLGILESILVKATPTPEEKTSTIEGKNDSEAGEARDRQEDQIKLLSAGAMQFIVQDMNISP
ncbi:unnamed protein product [Cladocopium goreaui]|uniref:Uncharacterized protein n=1 Tax=Cladocopium goreaui TaxID=2562237 RepID=A0A9P1DGQ6_9DINO|nr:unnamed protein product [Cladocopium goreaui]